MPNIEVTISVKQDGVDILGGPITRRVSVAQTSGLFINDQAASALYISLAPATMSEVDVLLIQPDQQVTVRLDNQADKGVILNAHGILLIVDGLITAGASTNVKVFDNSVATEMRGIVGGA